MWSRKELKTQAKANFKGHYWKSIGAFVVYALFTGTYTAASQTGEVQEATEAGDAGAGLILGVGAALLGIMIFIAVLNVIITNVVQVGYYSFLLNCDGKEPKIGDLFSYFKKGYGRIAGGMFVTDLIVALWSVLFCIPGAIAHYKYELVPFLLADNPEMTGKEARQKSAELMKGNKWNAFVLDLSFIGWYILGGCTCGILNLFWVTPYQNQTRAQLYLTLKK